jgi:hypothetical protein
MQRSRLAIPVAALALLLSACAEDPATTAAGQTGADPTGATATGSPPPSPSEGGPATPPPEEPAELEDGRHFGFLKSIDVDGAVLEFDLAYFLTGDEANAAAEEHGDETPVPNDYYIVNDNPRIRTLRADPAMQIALYDWDRCCDETVPGSLDGLALAINGGEPVTVDGHRYQGPLSPYWLTVEEGSVIAIEEQYLP